MKKLIIRLIARMLGTNIYFHSPQPCDWEPIAHLDNDTIRLEGIEYEVEELKQTVEFWHQSPSNDHAAIEFFRNILKNKSFGEFLEFENRDNDQGYGMRRIVTMRVLMPKK